MMAAANGSTLSSLNSRMNSSSCRPPTSLQLAMAYRSPSTSRGVRTLPRMILNSSSLRSPRWKSFVIGMYRPSSKTSRASADRIRPPMSSMWQVLAKYATTRPSRKIGVTRVMSLIWPAVIHGSLVISTSPASSDASG